MKTSRLITNYSKYSDPKLDVKAQAIIAALTDNKFFPETTPTLAAFTTTCNTYAQALTNAANRDRVMISLKNDARNDLLTAMRLLSINIESLAEGNRTKLVSSGFDLSDHEGTRPLTPTVEFVLQDGNGPGELKFMVNSSSNAKLFLFECTEEPLTLDSKWISKGSSKKEFVFSNLPGGKRIYGRVTAIGTRGQEVVSAVISRVVQ